MKKWKLDVKVMTYEKKRLLSILLSEYADELNKKCNYDCYNCELGIYETYYSMCSCAIETVEKYIDCELYGEKY